MLGMKFSKTGLLQGMGVAKQHNGIINYYHGCRTGSNSSMMYLYFWRL